MKTCVTCKEDKPLEAFHLYARSKDGRQAKCIECRKTYDATFYQANKAKRYEYVRNKRRSLNQWMLAYLKDKACVDCGENDPRVLEFDHVRGEKLADISRLRNGAASIKRIEEEIAKCDIRCANCHRKITFERAGSYRSIRPDVV